MLVSEYLLSSRKQFEFYKSLGEKTFEQLTEKELFWSFNEESNSIAVIVNHLWGNMKSRWTDFLNADGEKKWRNRDLEFESVIKSKDELNAKWEEGWGCLFKAIESLNERNFETKIHIRNQEHTVIQAVNRQLTHYSSHIGQIIFIGKMLKGNEWQSLSIPKGESKKYNAEKLSKGKHKGHFTDDFK